ncbi:MAG: hypothetical protein ACKO6J_00780 [Crocinitomicaceae bacterium]
MVLSCRENEIQTKHLKKQHIEISDSNKVKPISWKNPMFTPLGNDLVRMIRAYYLVGEVDKLLPFLLLPPSMDKKKLVDILQEAKWGYDLKVSNVRWMNDSVFELSVKTQKQQTTGMEFYQGKIVNDTAKLLVYLNPNCPFVKNNQN